MLRTFESNIKLVRTAIEDVCELLNVEIEDLYVSELKAVIEFKDGTKHWFMYSYSRIERQDVVTEMIDHFLARKRTDEEEKSEV